MAAEVSFFKVVGKEVGRDRPSHGGGYSSTDFYVCLATGPAERPAGQAGVRSPATTRGGLLPEVLV